MAVLLDMVRRFCTQFGYEAGLRLMKKFGVDRVSRLDKRRYGELHAAMKAMLDSGAAPPRSAKRPAPDPAVIIALLEEAKRQKDVEGIIDAVNVGNIDAPHSEANMDRLERAIDAAMTRITGAAPSETTRGRWLRRAAHEAVAAEAEGDAVDDVSIEDDDEDDDEGDWSAETDDEAWADALVEEPRATGPAAEPDDSCGCTILSTQLHDGSGPLCVKRFTRDAEGKVQKHGYGKAFKFAFQPWRLVGLNGLYRLLRRLEREPRRFIIRAEPVPDIGEGPHQRVTNPKPGRLVTLQRVARKWIMTDVDGVPCPPHIDPRRDPEEAAEYLASLYPAEFHGMSYIWQWSSSQSVESIKEGLLSCHLWWWLDRAIPDDELRQWAEWVNDKAGLPLADPRAFVSAQPNYTGAPIFENVPDPLPRRLGLRQKGAL
jgi:hypothetical protein